jgi:hypothetical protein
MGQGELFALSECHALQLADCRDVGHLMELIWAIEDACEERFRQPLGKEWNLIQCCLSDGTCNPVGGSYPLNHYILGGRHLLPPNGGYMAVLVMLQQVCDVNAALEKLGSDWFRERYTHLFDHESKRPFPEQPPDELQSLFCDIQSLYRTASKEHRAILFTTDETLDAVYWANQV